MVTRAQRIGGALLANLCLVALVVSEVSAQPGLGMGGGVGGLGAAGGLGLGAPVAGGYGGLGAAGTMMSTGGYGTPAFNSANPYDPYGTYNFGDPFGGYLKGVADVTTSQGKYLMQTQQAYLMREDVRRAQMDNKRRAFDLWKYINENTPSLEDTRAKERKELERRMMVDPPLPEIWSGSALNVLLNKSIDSMQNPKVQMPIVPIDEDTLRKINISLGGKPINLGVLKNDGKLSIPVAIQNLAAPGAVEIREELQSLAVKAFKDAKQGGVDRGTTRAMSRAVDRLRADLVKKVDDIPFLEYTEAKRFLGQVEDAIKALQEPGVGDFDKTRLRGNTVADVVKQMKDNGMKFAPAVAGEEGAYVALHRALAAFNASNTLNADR